MKKITAVAILKTALWLWMRLFDPSLICTIGWEELAADRGEWRSAVRRGKEKIEARIAEESALRHYRRHNPRL